MRKAGPAVPNSVANLQHYANKVSKQGLSLRVITQAAAPE